MEQTLKELLEARKTEEKKGITFILGDTEEVFISYKELYDAALSLLYELQQTGFYAGDQVVFQVTDNQKFIYSFWACQLGGMIPVPVTTGSNDEHKLKLFKIWDILINPKIIASLDFIERLDTFTKEQHMEEKFKEIKASCYCYESIAKSEKEGEVFSVKPEELAFIQFSSGSTGNPKGVMITHNNVFANAKAAEKWMKITQKDVCLNWMPLTHDMGLIGTHIKSVYLNIHQYNIHTNLFVRRPQLWMKKASEHKATLLYSPNFGYQYFLKYFREKEDLNWDLSSVRMIYNGAEPISLELCDEFLTKMAPYGLKRNSMHTVYGLAEATIAATFPPLNSNIKKHILNRNHLNLGEDIVSANIEDNQAIVFADEGYPLEDCYVKICNEEREDIGENRIGYIYIRGGNVTSGYYNDKEETNRVIDKDGWLNTNDLGFMKEKRLVVTGRAKDIIFVNGQNYYSHDMERVAEECQGVDMGMAVAIGVFNDKSKRDEIILFVLFKKEVSKFIPLVKLLKDHIYTRMGIRIDFVIPVKKIHKTTSGKVQRYRFRENYLKEEYKEIKEEIEAFNFHIWKNREIILPATQTEERILSIWKQIFEAQDISIEDDFFSLGGDSLKVTKLIQSLKESFGIELGYHEIFEKTTIKSQSAYLEEEKRKEKNEEKMSIQKYKNGDFPLSFSQQRMWFLDCLNNKSPQYNLYKGILLKGDIDIPLLEQALNLIANRHQILKMSFAEEKGIPLQLFHKDLVIPLEKTDLSELPEEEKEKACLKLADTIVNTPFDFTKAPLIKIHLIKKSKEEHLLLLCTHHILFDGWSFGIVIKEWMDNYKALKKDHSFTMKEAYFQYVDYANWQRERVKNVELRKQVSYWREKLKGVNTQINLPFDKTRPALSSYQGDMCSYFIKGEMVKKVKAYSKKTKTTPFMVLLSAFEVLLYRYSLDKEFAVGTSVANRSQKETEDMIGFFTNNLVLRGDIKEHYDFERLLQAVKSTTLEAYENQDVPFDLLVEELNIKRDMSINPLFQVMFTMQNTKLPEIKIDNIEGTYLDIKGKFARFDLAVDVHELNGEFKLVYEYNTDLFYKETICRMAANYNQILESVLSDPYILLDEIKILAEKEEEEVTSSYEKTAVDFGNIKNVIRLFEEQAKNEPNGIAVLWEDKSITYEELYKRAESLSGILRRRGIKTDSIVGIYLDRSIELLIAILGIFKAGAAYLPMDPIFPPSRLNYMIQDAKVEYIISQDAMISSMPEGMDLSKVQFIHLDQEQKKAESDCFEISYELSSKDLAYILYTSGSTGNPKGVQVEQGALVNFLKSMKEAIRIKQQDKWLAVTTVSFDISILELLLPLMSGGTVVIAKREDAFDGKRLLEMIEKENITIMQATPVTWKLMLSENFEKKENLKILCGGEALPKLLAEQLLQKGKMLFNLYGPTETTIWSTYKIYEEKIDKITIGKPIGNTSVYVLDHKLKPVPIGVPGELYIGGAGLARGYYHQEKLTEEKFISNPYYGKKDTSKRLYKTGDIVKYLNNLELEYVQRIDNQVKIRGFRIELEEIQSILSLNPFVKECVVAAKDTKQKEKILAAYMILQEGMKETDIKPEEVRAFLKEKLPEYMIPSAFVVMKEFPLTLNKKVDIKNLPDPLENKVVMTKEYEGATNEIEQSLVDIWKEALSLPQVGIKDNFFDLGGYSLLLAQVKSKIAENLKREIPMIELFQYPTIESLAGHLSGEEEFAVTMEPMEIDRKRNEISKDIAVIGLSGRFPGARDVEEFWNNLCSGKESILRFDQKEAIRNGAAEEDTKKPDYVTAWGVLGDIDKFDGTFFGYNPKEATVLDPQQRIFLEEVWKAFEYAGYVPDNYKRPIGIYASVGMNTYMDQLSSGGYRGSLANDYQVMTGNDKDFLATRVSYKLNLTGPSVTVQTACSSSLVAVHHACNSLRNGECDMAAAGGVSIRMPEKKGYLYQEGMILSKDGHCRAFDQSAGGTVGGNGAGVIILKRYEDAVEDKDEIMAVIKGSSINNDGSGKIGYTAPSVQGQTKAIQTAIKESFLNPKDISYIETHGTGTSLGDPIEIAALTKAFGGSSTETSYCAIGSVKTNIGHLDAAAGITGLIKTVLSIYHKKIVPSLHYKEANKEINFEASPFYVNTKLQDYKKDTPFCAGVSSFGIGGTNAHVILQEAPHKEKEEERKENFLFPISAKTAVGLYKKCEELKEFIQKREEVNLGDISYTLAVGRKEFEFRYCFIGDTRSIVLEKLEEFLTFYKDKEFKSSLEDKGRVIEDSSLYKREEIKEVFINGGQVSFESLFERKRNRTPLPVYPFEATSYWPSMKKEKKKEFTEFFYGQTWTESLEDLSYYSTEIEEKKEKILVLYDTKYPFVSEFIRKLKEETQEVYEAEFKDFEDSLESILKEIKGNLILVPMFGFLKKEEVKEYDFEKEIEIGEVSYLSLLHIVQTIGNKGFTGQTFIKVITNQMQKVGNEKYQRIGLHLLLGAIKVIPQEYTRISCSSIDIEDFENDSFNNKESAELLFYEVLSKSEETIIAYRGETRFIQTYQEMKIPVKDFKRAKIEDGDVYLITGGLGGVGLAMAEELTSYGKLSLVFLQRHPFIKEEEWETYLVSQEAEAEVCEKIVRLKGLLKKGNTITIVQGNVSSMKDMLSVKETIKNTYGKITGMIHAAGSAGGGMIQIKEKETVKKAWEAKVVGTAVLYEVFKEESLKNFFLFSSLNGVTGGFGQSDYSSANGFMDAFAKLVNKKNGINVISIGWERFPGVGMAKMVSGKETTKEHPLLGKLRIKEQDKWVFYRIFQSDLDWVLSEHHVFSIPTIAGTTYLEMARAAFKQITNETKAVIKDVVFLAPMAVPFGEKRDVITLLERKGNQYEFVIASRNKSEESSFIEHAKGKISPYVEDRKVEKEEMNLYRLMEKNYDNTLKAANLWNQNESSFIYFGERWKSLQWLSTNEKDALAKIILPDEFFKDLENLKLHPALLDVATGALRFVRGGNYLPFHYQSIEIKKSLEAILYPYFIFHEDFSKALDFITCDIKIFNEKGEVLIEIKNFAMRLVEKKEKLNHKEIKSNSMISRQYQSIFDVLEKKMERESNIFTDGLTIEEGKKIFTHILKYSSFPHVIVSKKDVNEAILQADYLTRLNLGERKGDNEQELDMHERPELSSAYVPCRNETEEKVRDIWERVLSIKGIGVLDEFFELGGDSLLLIQLHTKLKENFSKDFPVVDLYKYNTIALQAKLLSGTLEEESKVSFEQVGDRVTMQRSKMQQRRNQMQKMRGNNKDKNQ